MRYELKVNNKVVAVEVEPGTPLLWVLRDALHLNGTKYSCGIGICGACTVLVDGKPMRSCILPVESMTGKSLISIEGIGDEQNLHPVQQAWREVDVPQCGYCQSGQILSAIALLNEHPQPNDEQINAAMTNLCRCGTYPEIRAAIHLAANKSRKS